MQVLRSRLIRTGTGKAKRRNCRAGSQQGRHLFRIANQKLRARALSTGEGHAHEAGARQCGRGAWRRHRRFHQGVFAGEEGGVDLGVADSSALRQSVDGLHCLSRRNQMATTEFEEQPRIITPRNSRRNEIVAILLFAVGLLLDAVPRFCGFLSKRSFVEFRRRRLKRSNWAGRSAQTLPHSCSSRSDSPLICFPAFFWPQPGVGSRPAVFARPSRACSVCGADTRGGGTALDFQHQADF